MTILLVTCTIGSKLMLRDTSPGVVNIGYDSCSRRHAFESKLIYLLYKILFLFKRPQINKKRPEIAPYKGSWFL